MITILLTAYISVFITSVVGSTVLAWARMYPLNSKSFGKLLLYGTLWPVSWPYVQYTQIVEGRARRRSYAQFIIITNNSMYGKMAVPDDCGNPNCPIHTKTVTLN